MTLNKRMLPAAMLPLVLIGLHAGSQAGTLTTHHGAKCTSVVGISQPLFKAVNGIWNYINTAQGVVCPVTRVGLPTSGGLRVWIDGYAPSGSTLSCGLHNQDYNGGVWVFPKFTITGTGSNFDKYLELAKVDVPTYSSQAVYCDLPPGGGIYDIEPETLGS